MNNEYDWNLQDVLKRFSLWGGIALAIISIYFSYDGADTTITGGNPSYTEIAKYIMIVMAVMVTLIQFVFNTDFKKLSLTLRVVGAASYFYSIYTNYLGINHLFGFSGVTGAMIAIFMDVTPEALIAWSLEDETQGDLLGNLGKMVLGGERRIKHGKMDKREPSFRFEQPQVRPASDFKFGQNPAKKGKVRSFYEQKKAEREVPNRFGE
jgi:hypothetical protein